MWSDPLVVRHIGGRPFTRQETWSKMLRYVGHWELLGFGYWVIAERASGRFVGEVGFADFKRDLQPSIEGVPEMGWALAAWAHGKGYATEANAAALRWIDEQFEGMRTVCIIDPPNVASIRVAEKCGFKRYADTTYLGTPTVLYERTAGTRS